MLPRFLNFFGLLTFSASLVLSPGLWSEELRLPELGNDARLVVDTHQEQQLGCALLRRLRSQPTWSEDPIISEYLRRLGQKLLNKAPASAFPFRLLALNHPQINAFAFFGGHIVVHTGLISATTSESELAAVVAHEMAHLTQGHLPRIIAANQKLMPVTAAQVLGALALGALAGTDAGAHAVTAVMAGHVQQMLNFTREHEQEADRIGIQLLAKANFDPSGLPSVFSRLNNETRYHDKLPDYLLTHPLFESRIADAVHRAEHYSYRQSANSLDFNLIKAYLEVTQEPKSLKLIGQIHERIQKGQYADKTAALYGYAIALSKHRRHEEALKILQQLVKTEPHSWLLRLAYGKELYAAKQTSLALKELAHLYELYPTNHPIVCTYLKTLLKEGQFREAANLLKKLAPFDEDIFLPRLRAETYAKNGHIAESHLWQAEWYALQNNFQEAIIQLEFALDKTTNDTALKEKISERLYKMKELQKEDRAMSF